MRATLLVIDSFGIGALPDAGDYGDQGANTALHIAEGIVGPKWEALGRLGLGNAAELLGNTLPGCESLATPEGFYGVMAEKSPGKDTTTGHWELAGLERTKPFHVFPSKYPSFPGGLLETFSRETGRRVIGNKAASGTAIIEELGEEHMKTGALICYTSADSVFQIAAHEETVPLEELYRCCKIARKLTDPYPVGRVIARPFIGKPGAFSRTKGRRDFSLLPPKGGLMEHLQRRGVVTHGVGKIGDIFAEKGLTHSHHDKGNSACLDRIEALLSKPARGREFFFVNLVDTDMIYGHRRDLAGYGTEVEKISRRIPALQAKMDRGDILIITADHGCDPAFKGTDHTREYVPLLVYRRGGAPKEGSGNLGIREAFSDVAATVSEFFEAEAYPRGRSFLETFHNMENYDLNEGIQKVGDFLNSNSNVGGVF